MLELHPIRTPGPSTTDECTDVPGTIPGTTRLEGEAP